LPVVAGTATTLTIGLGNQLYEVAAGEGLTFGRSARTTLCLDATDLGISRVAGSLEADAGVWWLVNKSTVRITVIVEGATRRHALTIDLPEEAQDSSSSGPVSGPQVDGNPTRAASDVSLTSADKLALVALFSGYLEPFPRYDPHPKSYADAAARLDWPRTTLVKRVEYMRTRLTNAGVPNLLGDNALQHLAEWALATALIGRADLALLPPR
jgi:hypothetical protein